MTATSASGNAAAIAEAFVAARRAATPLGGYPGSPPASMAAAYAIQDAAIARAGGTVAGWKVGRIFPPHDEKVGANRLAGPIFADRIRHAQDAEVAMPVFAGGFAAVEAEFLFVLRAADPARLDYSPADALEMVEAVHVGIEIASSPLGAINALGPAVTASDFGNNNGLLVGPRIDGWRDLTLDHWPVTMSIDGTRVGSGRASAFPGGTAGAVCFLLETLARRGITVPAGTWLSSGAVSGGHEVAPGAHAVARFGDDYEVRCEMVAEEPRT